VAKLSDREEAVKIMEWLVDELGSIDRPTSGEKDNLADARSHLAEW
jgi:hypothetical protein